jgi:hypothetical protein
LELIRPSRPEGCGTDDESAQIQRGIFDETDGLTRLSEPHVIAENTATTDSRTGLFTIQHPSNTDLLMGHEGETGAWLNQGFVRNRRTHLYLVR